MKNSKIFAAVITFSMAVNLCGCADIDGDNSSDLRGDGQASDYSSSDESVDNEILMNVGEKSDFPTKCKVYKSKAKSFTEEQLLSLFTETPERTYYSETNVAVYTSSSERGNTDGKNLNFSTDAGMLCEMAYDTVGSYYDGEQAGSADLDFAALDEVLETVEKRLNELGFSSEEWFVNGFYTVKAADLDSFKQKQYEAAAENPYNLSESELQKEIAGAERIKKYPSKDCYYIDIAFKIDGFEMYAGINGLPYAGSYVLGSSCKICCSKDGIEAVEIYNVCETETSEDVEIIAPDKAQELIIKKYNDIVFDGEIEVNSIELIYMPIPQNDLGDYNNRFEVCPFYAFYYTLTEGNSGEKSSDAVTYFNAETGKELATVRQMSGMFIVE